MHLGKETAEDLLQVISQVIDYDIYIADEIGYIIASTNKARMNEYHIPSHKVVTENLDALIVKNEDEYPGCKVGINLPLKIDDEIAGVIGITGPVDEVEGYGKIIKMVTEILMQNINNMQQKNTRDQNRMFFVNSWLAGELVDQHHIESNAEEFGLDITRPMAVALVKAVAGRGDVAAFLDARITDPHVLTSLNSNDRDMGLIVMNADEMQYCRKYFEGKFNETFPKEDYRVAIGDVHERYNHIQTSYQEARKVLAIISPRESGIFDFHNNILRVAVNEISLEYKRRIVEKIFDECKESEKHEMAEFIVEYFEKNGSITAISEELFLHKNTVQYKIKKIKSKTRLDLRRAKDMIELYFAAIWYIEFFD
ncbi:MAG: helix-turn-helix domain-containing protein [Eubacteriaceae bacterium]|jgi:carbohydrate diacid regulator|nr:helix-turn-helix domain-containing protein [Eubacteriaceae bacterium]